VAAVEGCEDPCCCQFLVSLFDMVEGGKGDVGGGRVTLGGVEINALYAFGAGKELALDVEVGVSLACTIAWETHCCCLRTGGGGCVQ
jgi:hypothetical protein